ncbi:MAG: hypothetical protein JWO33_2058, partial [Caulobacteraceae bacterium]|nr:hypothetical protein [Caulobacteraceae bacterium]
PAAAPSAAPTPVAAPQACPPAGGVDFVCGVEGPEDLVPIPGTRWLIAGGLPPGAGMKLIDTAAKTARPFFTGAPSQLRPDTKAFANCPAAPDLRTFRTHGLYLRSQGGGRYTLYAVSHGDLEAVQVFTVDARGDTPLLAWIGCAPTLPGYTANGVAAFNDGTILVTVSDRPGATKAQELGGLPVGNVLERPPGAATFQVMAGAVMAGDNGIEISRDEREFYVVGFGSQTVAAFSRAAPQKPLRQTRAPGFMPDNLRWSGDRLIAAGPMYDEPACGGTRLAVVASRTLSGCRRGYMVAQLDPAAMTWKVLDYSAANPAITGISVAVVTGDTLWIGATNSRGVAYKPLPAPPPERASTPAPGTLSAP